MILTFALSGLPTQVHALVRRRWTRRRWQDLVVASCVTAGVVTLLPAWTLISRSLASPSVETFARPSPALRDLRGAQGDRADLDGGGGKGLPQAAPPQVRTVAPIETAFVLRGSVTAAPARPAPVAAVTPVQAGGQRRALCSALGSDAGDRTAWHLETMTGDWQCQPALRRFGAGSLFTGLRGPDESRITSIRLKMNLVGGSGGTSDREITDEAVRQLRLMAEALAIPLDARDYAAVREGSRVTGVRGEWRLAIRPQTNEANRINILLRHRSQQDSQQASASDD